MAKEFRLSSTDLTSQVVQVPQQILTGFMEGPEKNSRRSEERGTDDFIEVNGAAQQRNIGLCNFYSGAIVPSGVVQPALVVTELFAAGLLHRDAAIAS